MRGVGYSFRHVHGFARSLHRQASHYRRSRFDQNQHRECWPSNPPLASDGDVRPVSLKLIESLTAVGQEPQCNFLVRQSALVSVNEATLMSKHIFKGAQKAFQLLSKSLPDVHSSFGPWLVCDRG